MRTVLLAAAGLSVLLLTGCGADQPEASAPAQVPSAAGVAAPEGEAPAASAGAGAETPAEPDAAAGDAALSEDSEAICAQATRTSTSFGKTFAENLQLISGATGKPARKQARAKATRDAQNFSFALLDMSKLASEPALKKALSSMGAEVKALSGDLAEIDDKKLAKLQATLDKACGRS